MNCGVSSPETTAVLSRAWTTLPAPSRDCDCHVTHLFPCGDCWRDGGDWIGLFEGELPYISLLSFRYIVQTADVLQRERIFIKAAGAV
jgi:hypothetical protein